MSAQALERFSDLDFDLLQMTDDELDLFATASAESEECDLQEARTPVAFGALGGGDLGASLSGVPERIAA